MIARLLITLISILLLCCSCSKQLILTQERIQDNWQDVVHDLNKQTILRLANLDLTQQSINRILSLQLSQLQQLHFQFNQLDIDNAFRKQYSNKQVLTHRLIKTIFTSKYFTRISILNLRGTNIDDRSLNFLQNIKLSTSISSLSLQQNFIGKKGFKLLSKIQFTNLKALSLAGNLLKESQSIDAVIRIICGENILACRNNIEQIDLSRTNMEQEHFIRLLNRLNPHSLKKLGLQQLSLVYKTTYKQGFNYTVFEILSSKFTSLQLLSLKKSLINDDIAFIFRNWSLPNLTILSLQGNHITDKGVILWINKKNMPNLQRLNLISTEVSDGTIEHLAKENYQLISLNIGDCKITAKGGQKLRLLNTQRLQVFSFSFNMPSQEFNDLIQEGKFANLQKLIVSQNSLMVDIFTQINWSALKKLHLLGIANMPMQASLLNLFILSLSKTLSNIKILIIQQTDIDSTIMQVFLVNLSTFFPKLQKLIIQDESKIFIYPQILEQAIFNQGMFIVINNMQLIAKKDSYYQLISLDLPQFIAMSHNIEDITYSGIQSRLPNFIKQFDFQTIQMLTFDSQQVFGLYFKIFQFANIKILPKLLFLTLDFLVDVQYIMNTLSSISLPRLRQLTIKLLIGSDMDDKGLSQLINQFSLLQIIDIEVTYLNQELSIRKRKEFLDSLYFPFLRQLYLRNQNMEIQQVKQIVRVHNQTVRILDLGNNFLEKHFLNILVETEYVLQRLSLDSTSFSVEEFAIFGKITTQFMTLILLQMNDLTNQHIFAMLGNKNSSLLFPKLTFLGLNDNDIRKQGLQAILKTQMYQLRQIQLQSNNNPHYINLIFTYPTKIQFIQSINIDVYGIKSDLEPSSTSNLQGLILRAKNLFKQDFNNLARLSFSKLKVASFWISNQYSCQTLLNILKITKNVKKLWMSFGNDKGGLNSSCLSNISHISSISWIQIYDLYHSTHIPQFVERLLNSTSELTCLKLFYTKLSSSFFKKVFKRSFNQLQLLHIKNNQVGDQAFKILLETSQLTNLVYLALESSSITDTSIQFLAYSSLYNLKILILNQNNFGVKGMKILSQMQLNLQILSLKRCGLNGDSLAALTELKLDELLYVQLGYNNFKQEDIINFVANIQKKFLPSLQYIGLEGISLSKVNYDLALSILKAKNIVVQLDRPRNSFRVNSARY